MSEGGPAVAGVRLWRRAVVAVGLAAGLTAVSVVPSAARGVRSEGCPLGYARIACVDLSHQQMWVQDASGGLLFGPVPIRSGRPGYGTRTGMKKIYLKEQRHWSTLYHVSMPYSQFFDGGEAFHGYAGQMSDPPGSHGCVNMRNADAKALFGVTQVGDPVFVWGRKP